MKKLLYDEITSGLNCLLDFRSGCIQLMQTVLAVLAVPLFQNLC